MSSISNDNNNTNPPSQNNKQPAEMQQPCVSQTPSNPGDNIQNAPRKRFINWGQYKSTDKAKPDVLEVIPQSVEIYATSFSDCTNVSWKVDGSWVDAILPLKAHNSRNVSLINQWTKKLKEGRLQVGKLVTIRTWLDKSKNGNTIRRQPLST